MQTVLIVGFPNSGKSTIFNLLSGQSRKVSNYSGITVDSAYGELKSNKHFEEKINIIDLPGTYSLNPTSIDEGITTSFLLGIQDQSQYNLVALVLDMDRLESSLSLSLALKDLIGDKLVLIVNKNDKSQFTTENCQQLKELTGLNVLATSAHNNNPREIDRFLRDHIADSEIEPIEKLAITKNSLEFLNTNSDSSKINILSTEKEIIESVNSYHNKSREILSKVLSKNNDDTNFTSKLDKILIHPAWGTIIFMAIFYAIFHSIYTWSGPFMDIIDGSVGDFATFIGGLIPEGHLNSLITDGIIAGVGGVVIFVPQIVILFFLLSLLEQSGYISRAAMLTDKLMSVFGLNGKAFLPYMSGFACSIPGIMAARTIPNKKERMATIMTIPLITCSARLPVYVLLIGTFVPSTTVFGVINSQALSFFFLYFLGSFFALFMALVFRLTYYKGETSNFYIDLPIYQKPSVLTAIKIAATKGKYFVQKAGTIILALSIVIWFASTFPKPDSALIEGKTEQEVASITLKQSLLGTVGRTIEPALKPIGMDWKMGVGMLVAFGARELFVSTMGTIYALGDVDEESSGLRERLTQEKDPETGLPVYSLAVAWSILIFFVFSLQCTSTLAILKRETGGWKVPAFMFGYMTILAYVGSFIAFKFLS